MLTQDCPNPAIYAASALRQTLLVSVSGRIVLDLIVLMGMIAFVFWLVGKKMNWRQR